MLRTIKHFFTELYRGLLSASLIVGAAVCLLYSYAAPPQPFLAWPAFILFAFGIARCKSFFGAFFYGLMVGIIFYVGAFYWVYPSVQQMTGSVDLALLSIFGLACVLALQFSFFGGLCHFLRGKKWLYPLGAGCMWVALEFLHQTLAYYFLGFPFFVLAYSQFENLALIQIASYGGAYAVSFLIVFFGFSMALAAGKDYFGRRIIMFFMPLALITGALFYGSFTTQQQGQKLSVALMQPNTHTPLTQGRYEDAYYMVYDQAKTLRSKKLDLIIWPETSVYGALTDEEYENFLPALSQDTGALQIAGSYHGDNVTAALIGQSGVTDFYAKIKLVPFGEYLPFEGLLRGLYENLGIAALTGTFTPGKQPSKVFDLGGAKAGANICFESLFPSIWRAQAKAGAEFFVNITNDGWFLQTAAPYQHLRASVFRAVENGRPVLRAATTGISALISKEGQILYQSAPYTVDTALLDFYFNPAPAKTFYTKHGDIFAMACALLAITLLSFVIAFKEDKNGN